MNNAFMSERTKVHRLPDRGFYDFETITKILDDTFICHIGFVVENQPYVIPTCFGRENDEIFFHGAKGSRMLKAIKNGSDICITVTILDGIVLARSAFHHSVNYRSVVILGKAKEISESSEKEKALQIITEHIMPGRWNDVRKPNAKELNTTTVLSLNINEASAKIREGAPKDDEEDMDLEIWAGVLPLKIAPQEPIQDSKLKDNILLPGYLSNLKNN